MNIFPAIDLKDNKSPPHVFFQNIKTQINDVFEKYGWVFTPEKINANQIIIHHHLGLGDTIVCFGLVNKLSEMYDKIYLPIKDRYADMIKYLYKENKKIEFFEGKYGKSKTQNIKSILFIIYDFALLRRKKHLIPDRIGLCVCPCVQTGTLAIYNTLYESLLYYTQ